LGQPQLSGGFDFIAVMIGLFGLSEVLRSVGPSLSLGGAAATHRAEVQRFEVFWTMWRTKLVALKSSILGVFIGALPGAGADIAAWAAYGFAQRTSRTPKRFGTGHDEGVVAPSTAHNAAVAGAWIPMLVFGIPGDSVTAIALGALLMYNIKPGPLVFSQNGEQIQLMFLIALITQFLLLPAGWLGIRAFGPLILGLILVPMVEENLRAGLIKSGGAVGPFFTRPISLVLFLGLALALAGAPLFRRLQKFVTAPVNSNINPGGNKP
jgi:TctA family transporter